MYEDQPGRDEHKSLLVFNTMLIHTSQKCNLSALRMNLSVYGVMSRLVYQCKILIVWKVSPQYL